MSRWLKSMNSLLENLDGQAQQVADETENAISALLTPRESSASMFESVSDDDHDDSHDDIQVDLDVDIDVDVDLDDGNRMTSGDDYASTDGSYFEQTLDGDDLHVDYDEYDEYTEEEVLASDDEDLEDASPEPSAAKKMEVDEEEDDEIDNEMEEEEHEEIIVDDDDDDDKEDEGEAFDSLNGDSFHQDKHPLDAYSTDEDGISLPIQSRHKDDDDASGAGRDNDTVSDLSCSQYDDEANEGMLLAENSHSTLPPIDTRQESMNDLPPKTPNRQLSDKEQQNQQKQLLVRQRLSGANTTETTMPLLGSPNPPVAPPFGSSSKDNRTPAPATGASTATSTTPTVSNNAQALSPMRARRRTSLTEHSARSFLDESPVPPRRSLDVDARFWPAGNSSLLEEDADVAPRNDQNAASNENIENEVTMPLGGISGDLADDFKKSRSGHTSRCTSNSADSEHPPKLPTRQPSHPGSTVHANETSKNSSETANRPTQVLDGSSGNAQVRVSPMPPTTKKRAPASAGASLQQQEKQKLLFQKQQKEMQFWQQKAQSLQEKCKKAQSELKLSQSQTKQMEKQTKTLQVQLDASNAEIEAQQKELLSVADRLERDQKRAQDERDDLLDEQEDEMERIITKHTTDMAGQKQKFEQQIAALQKKVQLEETKRQQEGGDWTQELEQAIERERDALKKLNEVQTDRSTLQTQVTDYAKQVETLQSRLDASVDSAKVTSERELELDEKLESTIASHARQMQQRQARETELEQTIFELGTTLTAAQQQQQANGNGNGNAGAAQAIDASKSVEDVVQYKDMYERVAEEFEAMKGQLTTETHRREALQKELEDIARERREEELIVLTRQREQEEKASKLESTIAKLRQSQDTGVADTPGAANSNTTGSDLRMQKLSAELKQSKKEVANLSEQLVRYQGRTKAKSSEVLALKDRLEAANSRAENAEKSLLAQTSPASAGNIRESGLTSRRMFEVESGGVRFSEHSTARRRVKGGGRMRGNSTAVRSIRTALRLGPASRGRRADTFAQTLDAVDLWTVETFATLRQEPLARLAFLLYFTTLHIWSFALVVFHTAEVPHGDFGSMGGNPRNWRQHD